MTDIPAARLRQFLRLAQMLGSVAITRADTAQHARAEGHPLLAAQIEASALMMAREALDASLYLMPLLTPSPDNDDTAGGEG